LHTNALLFYLKKRLSPFVVPQFSGILKCHCFRRFKVRSSWFRCVIVTRIYDSKRKKERQLRNLPTKSLRKYCQAVRSEVDMGTRVLAPWWCH